jgi:PEP-CTERM motif
MKTITGIAPFAIAIGMFASTSANAAVITCQPDDLRVATLSDAVECRTANSTNLNDSDDLNALFGTSYNWINEGELTAAGSNDLFTVNASSWGTSVEGEWFIADSFWDTYENAVITMHVGQGGGDPDAFAWLITPDEVEGWFSYNRISGSGGGLSNLFLFGSGTRQVPEPATLALLGIGLAGMALSRRRRVRSA